MIPTMHVLICTCSGSMVGYEVLREGDEAMTVLVSSEQVRVLSGHQDSSSAHSIVLTAAYR